MGKWRSVWNMNGYKGCVSNTDLGNGNGITWNGNTGMGWHSTHCDRMVKAALVMDAGRCNSLATARHAFFFMTCTCVCMYMGGDKARANRVIPGLHTDTQKWSIFLQT